MGATSSAAGKLFVIAGILWFVEIPISFFFQNEIIALIGGAFGVFFVAGAVFAYRGTMAPIYEKDSAGYDIVSRPIGEYEVACYCGLLGPLAIIISFVSASMVGEIGIDTLPVIIPGLLGGLIATAAGIVYMRAARKYHKSQPRRTYY